MAENGTPHHPPRSEIVSVIAASSNAWAVVALVALLMFTAACTVDRDKLARERENLRTICENPVTTFARTICDRYATTPPATLEEAPPE